MGEDGIEYYKRYINEDGTEMFIQHNTGIPDLIERLHEVAPTISTEYLEEPYLVTTTDSTGDYWSSTNNYTYDPITNTFILRENRPATATDPYYTTQRSWNYTYKNRYCTMTCEKCGAEKQVLTEEFRVGYVCDECKSSVPLLIVLRKYFRTINW